MSDTLNRVEGIVRNKKPSYIVTPNVDHMVKLYSDSEFRNIYQNAHLILPDGMPLIWASHLLRTPLDEKVSGSDLFMEMCKVSSQRGYRLFLLGGESHAAIERTAVRLENSYPGLNVCGYYSPPFGFDQDMRESKGIIRMIRDLSPDILFLGCGAPKSEKWVFKHLDDLAVPLSVSVGISFAYAARDVKRAPRFLQRIGAEWIWRLQQEPKRLWKRYLIDSWIFVHMLAVQLFAGRRVLEER